MNLRHYLDISFFFIDPTPFPIQLYLSVSVAILVIQSEALRGLSEDDLNFVTEFEEEVGGNDVDEGRQKWFFIEAQHICLKSL